MNPKDPQAELREAIVIKLNSMFGQNYVETDEGTLFTTEIADDLVALFQAHQQELLSELLGELETPVYPETMAYVEMVKKASENGKYDDMFDNGFKAARSVIEKYREGLHE